MCLIVFPFPFSLWLPRSSEPNFWLNSNDFVGPCGLHICILSFLSLDLLFCGLLPLFLIFLLFIFFKFIACFLVSFLRSFVRLGGVNRKWLQVINRMHPKHSLITNSVIWELELPIYFSGSLLSHCVSWFGEQMVLQL